MKRRPVRHMLAIGSILSQIRGANASAMTALEAKCELGHVSPWADYEFAAAGEVLAGEQGLIKEMGGDLLLVTRCSMLGALFLQCWLTVVFRWRAIEVTVQLYSS